jgi:hypothetical protein
VTGDASSESASHPCCRRCPNARPSTTDAANRLLGSGFGPPGAQTETRTYANDPNAGRGRSCRGPITVESSADAMGTNPGENQVSDHDADIDELWVAYVRAEQAADETLRPFLAALPQLPDHQGGIPDPFGYLSPHLHGGDGIYALRVLERWPEVQRRRLLPDLIAASTSVSAPLFFGARLAIASLERTWLEATIEPYIWQQLGPEATDEQYRRLAELVRTLGLRDLLKTLVDRAAASPDENIREVAEDFGS